MSGQVLDVLVRLVDDFRQLLAVDQLLVHVHRDAVVEVGQPGAVAADNLRDGGTPETKFAQLEACIDFLRSGRKSIRTLHNGDLERFRSKASIDSEASRK